jgi:5-methylcytosine-specific restriction endonuclease McrA
MERGSDRNEGNAEFKETISAAGSDDLAVLGRANPPTNRTIHPQTQSAGERPSGAINPSNVLRLLEWQEYRCALTGRLLSPDSASLDHIIPVRDGGGHTLENVQVLHKEVNRAKSTLTHDQFIQMCREVVDHVAFTKSTGEAK